MKKYSEYSSSILVTGITSLKLGAMESDNLGNFIIIESLFRSLRNHFRKSTIHSTLQLSEKFSKMYNLNILQSRTFWIYNRIHTLMAVKDLFIVLVWRMLMCIKVKLNFLLKCSERIKAFHEADFILDFNGDMFGDHALNRHQFFMGVLNPVLAKLLGKNIFFVASSPGPFQSVARILLAKFAFQYYDLVAVREPASLTILNGLGFTDDKFTMYPCFSFGFQPYDQIKDEQLKIQEPFLYNDNTTLIGLIISNLNMKELPADKWPRDDWEYQPFIELVTHLVLKKNATLCVFSHRNKYGPDQQFKLGADHSIIRRLVELLPENVAKSVFTLNCLYDASSMNKIISRFEFMISGRIHGAIQAIMQSIPTMIIDYGLKPKAHKLKGFAILSELYEYLSDPADSVNMINNFSKLWENKTIVRNKLRKRIPELVQQAEHLWETIDSFTDTPLSCKTGKGNCDR